MYERFRNELQVKLARLFGFEDYQLILRTVDAVAQNYSISADCTSLTAWDCNQIPEMVQTYIACKKIEGLAESSLVNYALALKNFFAQVRRHPAR